MSVWFRAFGMRGIDWARSKTADARDPSWVPRYDLDEYFGAGPPARRLNGQFLIANGMIGVVHFGATAPKCTTPGQRKTVNVMMYGGEMWRKCVWLTAAVSLCMSVNGY